jgi:hypothetical protein
MYQKLTFSSRIVLELLSKFPNITHEKGYHLYTDRFYTYLDLAWELLKRKVHISGTVLQNRRVIPKEMKKKPFKHAYRKQLCNSLEGQKNGYYAEYVA